MGLAIAYDPPPRPFADAVLNPVLRVVGILLVTVGSIALLLGPPLAWAHTLDVWTAGDGPWGVLEPLPAAALRRLWWGWPLLVGGVLAVVLGIFCLSAGRRLVLFLRRFRRTGTTQTVTRAARKLGRRWRFVTLDDTQVTAVGVRGPLVRRHLADTLGFGSARPGMLRLLNPCLEISLVGLVGSAVARPFVDLSWVDTAFEICLAVFGGSLALATYWHAAQLFIGGPSEDALYADYTKRSQVGTEEDLVSVQEEIAAQARKLTGSRLAVVTVETPLWRAAVTALAGASDIPLVDVSEPTEAVLWEVEQMVHQFGPRCVMVGEAGAVTALRDSAQPDATRLRELLGDIPVYVYTADRAGTRRFTRTLRAVLESRRRLTGTPRPAGIGVGPRRFTATILSGGYGDGLPARLAGRSREMVRGLATAPDGTWLAVAHGPRVEVWEVATGRVRGGFTRAGELNRVERILAVIADPHRTVTGVAVAPDASWIASIGDGAIQLWDVATGRERASFGQELWTQALAVAPDGSWLATAHNDRTVRLWNVATGEKRATLTGHTGPVTSVAIAPDGTWLGSGSGDKTVRLWDLATSEERASLGGHTGNVNAVAIAPDGSWLASADHDGTVRLWDVTVGPGRAVRTHARAILSGHVGPVYAVAVAPDGTWLVSTSDATARVWDVATATEHAILAGHGSRIEALAIAPDCTWIATGSVDKTVRIWRPRTWVSAPSEVRATAH